MKIKDIITDEYAVIDDFGDNYEWGEILFHSPSLEKAEQYRETENLVSSSIVCIDSNGLRTKIN